MKRILTKQQARQFILAHQGLLGHRKFEGKEGILVYIKKVGCLQFDPLNVVGYNQELVLQSRIQGFRSSLLEELLYEDRKLVDGWDKNMSIYPTEDWPFFARIRESARNRLLSMPHVNAIVPQVMERMRAQGPLSSSDLEYNEVVDWPWAPTRLSRAVLESMYFTGDLIIHHKERTRKVYHLASRFLPDKYLQATEPNPAEEDYWQWYVLRRIGAIGLLWNKAGDAWLGIDGLKGKERTSAIHGLLAKGDLIALQIEGVHKQEFYMRAEDEPLLDEVMREDCKFPLRAFILAPLDNMMWDRRLIKELFGFEYRWEVYKPAVERQFGYYVLPIMCGDLFVGRFEPGLDKKMNELIIKNWWWEPDIPRTEELFQLLRDCMEDFMRFTDTGAIRLEGPLAGGEISELEWLSPLLAHQ